jgi:Tol biopolymer transport system component
VFTHNPSSTRNASAIYTIRIGDRPRRLTPERFAWAPSWSPGEDAIAFLSDEESFRGEIYVMDSDGKSRRRLTRNDEVEEDSLAWAPNGRLLAYIQGYELFRIGPSGNEKRLLDSSADYLAGVAWSPDGRTIAFGREDDVTNLSVVDTKGANLRQLTSRDHNFNPSWSPDGRWLAFSFFTRLAPGGRQGIGVVAADGRTRRTITSGADAFPAWRPAP